jgi:hypothetical protein
LFGPCVKDAVIAKPVKAISVSMGITVASI